LLGVEKSTNYLHQYIALQEPETVHQRSPTFLKMRATSTVPINPKGY